MSECDEIMLKSISILFMPLLALTVCMAQLILVLPEEEPGQKNIYELEV